MTFKEFDRWCNERACDGLWGYLEFNYCVSIIKDVRRMMPWKREKYWKKNYAQWVVKTIVTPINNRRGGGEA